MHTFTSNMSRSSICCIFSKFNRGFFFHSILLLRYAHLSVDKSVRDQNNNRQQQHLMGVSAASQIKRIPNDWFIMIASTFSSRTPLKMMLSKWMMPLMLLLWFGWCEDGLALTFPCDRMRRQYLQLCIASCCVRIEKCHDVFGWECCVLDDCLIDGQNLIAHCQCATSVQCKETRWIWRSILSILWSLSMTLLTYQRYWRVICWPQISQPDKFHSSYPTYDAVRWNNCLTLNPICRSSVVRSLLAMDPARIPRSASPTHHTQRLDLSNRIRGRTSGSVVPPAVIYWSMKSVNHTFLYWWKCSHSLVMLMVITYIIHAQQTITGFDATDFEYWSMGSNIGYN